MNAPKIAAGILWISFTFPSVLVGCHSDDQTILEIKASRIDIFVRRTPSEMARIVRTEKCKLVPQYAEGTKELLDTIEVRGSGFIWWPRVSMRIREDCVIVNGTEIEASDSGIRNAVVDNNGEVHPDCFLPFEYTCYPFW